MNAVILSKVEAWLNGNYDQTTKDEIKKMQQERPDELIEAFYQILEFGTGGLRGIMGVGTNRMNKYTVGMATQGYVNYLKQVFGDVKVAENGSQRYKNQHYHQRWRIPPFIEQSP